jgi:hypothetical protein
MVFFENHSFRSPGPIFPKFGLIDTIDVHRIITPKRTKSKLWGIEMLGMLDMGKGAREKSRRFLLDNISTGGTAKRIFELGGGETEPW